LEESNKNSIQGANEVKTTLDLAQLEKKLKNLEIRSSVMNILESAIEENVFSEYLIFKKLQVLIGREAANTLLLILNINDLNIVKEMEKAKVSRDVISFVLELLTKFGERLKDRQAVEEEPFVLSSAQTMGYYLPESEKIMFAIRLRRNDGEKFHFETSFESTIEILNAIAKDMLNFAITITNSMPHVKLAFSRKEINELRSSLLKLSKSLRV
jgi:hypothetical protein